jgi:hypothetical protein
MVNGEAGSEERRRRPAGTSSKEILNFRFLSERGIKAVKQIEGHMSYDPVCNVSIFPTGPEISLPGPEQKDKKMMILIHFSAL